MFFHEEVALQRRGANGNLVWEYLAMMACKCPEGRTSWPPPLTKFTSHGPKLHIFERFTVLQ